MFFHGYEPGVSDEVASPFLQGPVGPAREVYFAEPQVAHSDLFFADPYQEPEVVRSIVAADVRGGFAFFSTAAPLLAEREHIEKTVLWQDATSHKARCGFPSLDAVSEDGLEDLPDITSAFFGRPQSTWCESHFLVFQAGTSPPRLSSSPFAPLEPSSIEVQGPDPVALGNAVLDCLRAVFDANFVKINTNKFTFKADILHNAIGKCTIKVRFYEVEPGRNVMEMQRFQGDSLLFAAIFRRLCKHLEARGFSSTSHLTQVPLSTLPGMD